MFFPFNLPSQEETESDSIIHHKSKFSQFLCLSGHFYEMSKGMHLIQKNEQKEKRFFFWNLLFCARMINQ